MKKYRFKGLRYKVNLRAYILAQGNQAVNRQPGSFLLL